MEDEAEIRKRDNRQIFKLLGLASLAIPASALLIGLPLLRAERGNIRTLESLDANRDGYISNDELTKRFEEQSVTALQVFGERLPKEEADLFASTLEQTIPGFYHDSDAKMLVSEEDIEFYKHSASHGLDFILTSNWMEGMRVEGQPYIPSLKDAVTCVFGEGPRTAEILYKESYKPELYGGVYRNFAVREAIFPDK